jgi:DNA-binding IclR family transcriptional regulator
MATEDRGSLTQAFREVAEPLDWAEAVNLSVLTGGEVMYVSCRQGTDPLGARFHEGWRLPAVFTATGKAILSTMPDDEVVELLVTLSNDISHSRVRHVGEAACSLAAYLSLSCRLGDRQSLRIRCREAVCQRYSRPSPHEADNG